MQAEWSKVEAAQRRYYAAAEQYNRVLQQRRQESRVTSIDGTLAVRTAGDQQTAALREYMSLLQAFSRLAAREP